MKFLLSVCFGFYGICSSALIWQKEASDKSDISRKRAKCVFHLHWRQWNIRMSYLIYLLVGWVFLHEIWPGRRAHYVNYENINNSNLDGMSLASFCQSRAALLSSIRKLQNYIIFHCIQDYNLSLFCHVKSSSSKSIYPISNLLSRLPGQIVSNNKNHLQRHYTAFLKCIHGIALHCKMSAMLRSWELKAKLIPNQRALCLADKDMYAIQICFRYHMN